MSYYMSNVANNDHSLKSKGELINQYGSLRVNRRASTADILRKSILNRKKNNLNSEILQF